MSTNQIREVKEATDIVQIIGERLTLQRAGKNFRALCPFHSEKSPSFFVTPDIQVFRCFGCGERGDVFTFLERYEGLTFAESLRMLAERAGIKLESHHFTPEDTQRDRLFQVLDLSKAYYHYLLTEHDVGQHGRTYLQERGVTKETIAEFQVGFAPESWDGLIKYIYGKKKFSLDDLLASGLIIQREGTRTGSTSIRDYYDRFRNRIIFPLTDHRGRVVGFSGRVLNPEEKSAKYINTPETAVYHKSELLFGYSQHYRALREAQTAIIVEGEFDVLSSAQAHVRNVVAIKGSAFTRQHAERLQRVVQTIVLSLDADKAGVAATKRAIEIARGTELRIKVLTMSGEDKKDPDELARSNPKAWREHVKKAISAYQFLIDSTITRHDLTTGEGKQAVVTELAEVLLNIPHVIEQSHYIEELARKLQVSPEILRKDLQSYTFKKTQPTTKVVMPETAPTPREKLEMNLLTGLLSLSPEHLSDMVKDFDSEWMSHPGYQQIIKKIQSQKQHFSVKKFTQILPEELQPLFAEVYLQAVHDEAKHSVEVVQLNLQKVRQLFLKDQEKVLTQRIAKLDAIEQKTSDQETEQEQLLVVLQQLRQKMKA